MKTLENPINNNVFDTRDLIDYRAGLATELVDNWNELSDEDHQASDIDDLLGTSGFEFADDIKEIFSEFEADNSDEINHYNNIVEFCEELEVQAADYRYGESVIHESYFTEYTEETLVDCGYLPKDLPSWIVIDMEATAENVKVDYCEVNFEGETYYIRNV